MSSKPPCEHDECSSHTPLVNVFNTGHINDTRLSAGIWGEYCNLHMKEIRMIDCSKHERRPKTAPITQHPHSRDTHYGAFHKGNSSTYFHHPQGLGRVNSSSRGSSRSSPRSPSQAKTRIRCIRKPLQELSKNVKKESQENCIRQYRKQTAWQTTNSVRESTIRAGWIKQLSTKHSIHNKTHAKPKSPSNTKKYKHQTMTLLQWTHHSEMKRQGL